MMGCLCAKAKSGSKKIKTSDSKRNPNGYSWENKEEVNPKDFIIENAKDETIVRLPGSVKGQQFIIQNCEEQVLDSTKQFLFVCATILSSLSKLLVGAKLRYDLNRQPAGCQTDAMDARIEDFFPLPSPEKLGDLQIMTDPQSSLVSQTHGCLQRLSMQYCLVVFFADGHAQNRALSLIKELEQTDNILLRTKEILLEEEASERIFGTNAYNKVVKRGPVIGLEYNGKDCISMCLETAKNIATSTGCTGLVYVSTCPKTARKQIENFFSHADVQLSSQ
ncbi:protein XRP2 [Trichonephila clavipes]|nr:protein XRP2 [Trichonephila clavipes]